VTFSPHLSAISPSLWGLSKAMQSIAMPTGSPIGARSFLRPFQSRVLSTLRYPESEGKQLDCSLSRSLAACGTFKASEIS
jgi:hypothetical protein